MIILVTKNDNIARYALNDGTFIQIGSSHIKVGDPLGFVIGDMNSTNTTKYDLVSDVPGDYYGSKYKYDGANWSMNPDWIPPLTDEELAALHEENKS